MKTKLIEIMTIVVLAISLYAFPVKGANFFLYSTDTLIQDDSMNLAILEMDYLTNHFIRASVLHYPLCNCDQDSLPFLGQYQPPMDFGDMKFLYTFNNQLLFGGTLVWMGTGQIYYPASFTPASAFPFLQDSIPLPSNAQYLYWWVFPGPGYNSFIAKSDSVWKEISSLELVHQFAVENQMRVGFFGYAPSQGLFDPNPARWIIFLYRGNSLASGISKPVKEKAVAEVYPNPASDHLQINTARFTGQSLTLTLFDVTGRICLEKTILPSSSQKIDIQPLKSGVYQYQLKGNGVIQQASFIKR
ncbi:MAG: T9SS type A sorting domain-containing protein [Bacteroidetes bacterium]|nr:T9SS type A sorting domain-containing protein [Bacteroidota bacterium]